MTRMFMCKVEEMKMIRKKPRKIPYNEVFGRTRIAFGKPSFEEAEVEEDELQ